MRASWNLKYLQPQYIDNSLREWVLCQWTHYARRDSSREVSYSYPSYSCHSSCCLQLPGHEHDGFLLALHKQEGQQCCKDNLGTSLTPLQGPRQGALHHLVITLFLCLLPVGPKPASHLGCTSPHHWHHVQATCVFRVGNWNRGKAMCGESTKINWRESAALLWNHTWVTLERGGQDASSSSHPQFCLHCLEEIKPAVCWGQHRYKLLFKMLWCFVLWCFCFHWYQSRIENFVDPKLKQSKAVTCLFFFSFFEKFFYTWDFS